VRESCGQSPGWAADAGNEWSFCPLGQHGAEPGQDVTPGTEHAGCPGASGPLGIVSSSSARHGRLRRNAVSLHGVSLRGAPGGPIIYGCSPANRAFAVNFLRNGIVSVPEVFDAGCTALFRVEERGQPDGNARSGDVGERYCHPGAPRLISQACGNRATHGGTQSVAGILDIRRLSEQRESTLALTGAAVPGRRA
jgi:hypothetical protein